MKIVGRKNIENIALRNSQFEEKLTKCNNWKSQYGSYKIEIVEM